MTRRFLPLALAVMIAAGMCGCDGGFPGMPEQQLNAMTPPVKLIAVSAEGDTIIQDADGRTAVFPATYYFSKAIREAFKVGDTIKPANHAPVVVTNTVYVTNAVEGEQ